MRSPSVSGILVCDFELRRTQRPARKDPHQIDRQILANSFDVFHRCIRKEEPDPVRHLAVILVLIGQYDNDLGVKFRTDLIGHFRSP
jgi:hypothetical protein